MNIHELFEAKAVKQRLDAKCWTGKHKEGTKIKGGVRVNNCVPNEGIEVVSEFAPPGGDDDRHDPEELLFRLAKQWWLGTESDMIRVERTLASMGWEIGEDEGYDDGGVFVVQAGDENGKSYISWPHEDLADEGVAEAVDIGQEWMSDTELDQYVPERLQQQWRELLGYDRNGNPSALWANLTGGYEPDVNDPQHRALMVKVANKWFAAKKIPNVKFFDVKDADDELEWLVQIGQQGVAEGELDEKSTSQAQFRTMAAAAHNPEFARKVGIKPSVAKEFHGADRKQSYRSLPKKVDEGIMDFMQPQQPKTTKDKLSIAAMRQIEKARADKERQDPKYVRSVDLPKNPDHVRVVTDAKGDYKPPKEADYGDEYQAMVRRVAAQEKRKQQQPKPAKREDSNMPVAVDSTSPIHGTNEDSEGISTKNISPASRKLIQKARQATPDARSDIDAVFAYLDDVARRTQDNYGKVNDILQQLDPLSSDLDRAEQELASVRQVNQGQQQLLGRLKSRLDKGGVDTAPAQAQAQQDKRDAGERDAIGQQLDQQPTAAPVVVAPRTDTDTKQQLDKVQNTVNTLYNKDLAKTSAEKIKGPYAHQAKRYFNQNVNRMTQGDPIATQAGAGKVDPKMVSDLLGKDEISEDIYESRLYKMKLAGYFD